MLFTGAYSRIVQVNNDRFGCAQDLTFHGVCSFPLTRHMGRTADYFTRKIFLFFIWDFVRLQFIAYVRQMFIGRSQKNC